MNAAASTLPTDVQQRIDEHLDAIYQAMARGALARSEQHHVTDEV